MLKSVTSIFLYTVFILMTVFSIVLAVAGDYMGSMFWASCLLLLAIHS
jgi:hypothetical protein